MKKQLIHATLIASILFGTTNANAFLGVRNIFRNVKALSFGRIFRKSLIAATIIGAVAVAAYFLKNKINGNNNNNDIDPNNNNNNNNNITVNQNTNKKNIHEAKKGEKSNQDQPKTDDPSVKTHECVICLEDKPQQDCHTLPCNHAFCRGCLEDMVDLAIQEKNTTDLKCPNCQNKIDEPDVRLITNNNPEKLNAFNDITFQEWAKTNQNAKNCPTPDCGYVFEIDEEPETTRCPRCDNRYCSHCLHPHRRNITCQEAERLRANEDKSSEDWIKQNTKPCPRCNARVERNGGCLYVVCTCGHGFCWNCLGEHHVSVCNNLARAAATEEQEKNAKEKEIPAYRLNRVRNRNRQRNNQNNQQNGNQARNRNQPRQEAEPFVQQEGNEQQIREQIVAQQRRFRILIQNARRNNEE